MMQLRQKADYNCAYDVSKADLGDYIELSRAFIRTIEQLILSHKILTKIT